MTQKRKRDPTHLKPIDIKGYYSEKQSTFQSLADVLQTTITNLLKISNINFLTVGARVKTLDSLTSKIERKRYNTIEEITDIVGVRVITYLESDIDLVNGVIKSAFKIYEDQSINKSEELDVDQIGYRSIHHICDLGKKRFELTEFKLFEGMKFEIQVRTILQHAWAEIEHDRSYKFFGDLPNHYRRRVNLLAGTLELVDREFSTLAKDIDAYSETQKDSSNIEIKNDDPISQHSVMKYIDTLPIQDLLYEKFSDSKPNSAIEELKKFGISNINEMRQLLSKEYLDILKEMNEKLTRTGLIRRAMMYSDIDKYFSQAWPRSWRSMSKQTRSMLTKKYGKERIAQIVKTYLTR